jgi:chromosome segregation ATPase
MPPLLLADVLIGLPPFTIADIAGLVAIVAFVLTVTTTALSLWMSGKFTKKATYENLHRKLEERVELVDKRLSRTEEIVKRVDNIDERQQEVIRQAAVRDESLKAVLGALTDNSGRLTAIERGLRETAAALALTQQPIETFHQVLSEVKALLKESLEKTERWMNDHEKRVTRLETIEKLRKHNGHGDSRSPTEVSD